MRTRPWLLGAVLLAAHAWPALGQDAPIKVGIALFPPNVAQGEGSEGYTGFDIELWEEIRGSLKIESEYELFPLERLLEAIKEGEVDAAMAGITIRADRDAVMDFSYSYLRSGLRILTKADEGGPALFRLLESLPASGIFKPIGYLVAFLLVCSHVLFFVERGSAAVNRNYVPGIFEAAWCIIATMTTVGYGDITPHRWLGRLVAFVVMVTGIGLFGIIIAELSAGMTMVQLSSDIRGPEDLRDRRVATVAGSTSVDLIRRYGARLVEVEGIEDAYGLLQAGGVDAVVFDGPPLSQYAKENTEGDVILVGPLLNTESYGIAFPEGSPLREDVNRALLKVQEDGTYDKLYSKWFGDQP
ncbi:MAG: transporter substrate-binding domain-containing protein [Acidobacteria bacterium]|nr:transporter substrate-binding domain-containing protein [Acidobacteriota bacterium]